MIAFADYADFVISSSNHERKTQGVINPHVNSHGAIGGLVQYVKVVKDRFQ